MNKKDMSSVLSQNGIKETGFTCPSTVKQEQQTNEQKKKYWKQCFYRQQATKENDF